MSFSEYKAEVNSWLDSTGHGKLNLNSCDEKEHRFNFNITDSEISFHIVLPTVDIEGAKSDWVVWSDKDEDLNKLRPVLNYIDCQEGTKISDLLTSISQLLIKTDDDSDNEEFQDAVGDDEGNDDDDGDGGEDYYAEDLFDRVDDRDEENLSEEDETENFFASKGNQAAVKRLLKAHFAVSRKPPDLKSMKKEQGKYGFVAEPRNNNLFLWDVKLMDIPEDTILGKDVRKYAEKYKKEVFDYGEDNILLLAVIYMEMQFPDDYPIGPPFVRVVRPRFKFLTGHVTIGGSICMEMLTKSGWRPTNDIESILIQIRSEILMDKNAALNVQDADRQYTEQEARDAFNRMVQRYGWNK